MQFRFTYNNYRVGGQFVVDEGITLLGHLVDGDLKLGDQIFVPLTNESMICGEVVRFTESFDDWLGLPFYDRVGPETCGGEFCVEIFGVSEAIQCPGVAIGKPLTTSTFADRTRQG